MLPRYKDDNKLHKALQSCNEWRASWRMASHTAMLDCISAGGTSRARSPGVLAVLRHDLDLSAIWWLSAAGMAAAAAAALAAGDAPAATAPPTPTKGAAPGPKFR